LAQHAAAAAASFRHQRIKALNGVLNPSVLDGWWIGACIDGVTGRSIGADPADAIYVAGDGQAANAIAAKEMR
jgi:glucan phosphorylase